MDDTWLLSESKIISSYDYDKHRRLLEAARSHHGTGEDPVALSALRTGALLTVFPDGHVVAQEKGMFSKRVEIVSQASYENISSLSTREKGVRGRDGLLIEATDRNRVPLFELSWGYGDDPLSPETGLAERARLFRVISQLAGLEAA
jgi:hypothetical protein